MNSTAKTKKPQINPEGLEMLERHILKTSNPSPEKTVGQMHWDDCKRHILQCIYQQFEVR